MIDDFSMTDDKDDLFHFHCSTMLFIALYTQT